MTAQNRLAEHPILAVPERKPLHFFYNDQKLESYEGEVISSALFAHGIKIFGHHHRDGSPQGIFCANGQCAQCTVIADGLPVKSCMTPVREGMKVTPCDGLPELPAVTGSTPRYSEVETVTCDVLIIGGGPSGISAALELGKLGREVILVDDKSELGGKLVLQTHTFFGSIKDCYAGTRGIDIATKLAKELESHASVKVWLDSAAVAVFSDKLVGIVRQGSYVLVEPKVLLNAAGAREKALAFPGCDLPGVYGAGAFQTLLNRDLVKPAERLFIIGGGNVGIIAGYHALQAGITVVGLVEAMPQVGGYRVHADKLRRFGVPLLTSHSVMRCEGGKEGVERIVIAQVDEKFKPLPGTFKTFEIDTVLVAVGLNPIDELFRQARSFGMEVFATGDAEEIAEASAAMFSGKIKGLEVAEKLGEKVTIPDEWRSMNDVLKQKPGKIEHRTLSRNGGALFPVFHCTQEIPCNPCTEVCPNHSISIDGGGIMGLPSFSGKCSGCMKCVAICPGLAVTLVDYRKAGDRALVTIPFELHRSWVKEGDELPVVDKEGTILCQAAIVKVSDRKFQDRTLLVTLEVPADKAAQVAGVKLFTGEEGETVPDESHGGDPIICRCERVSSSRIKAEIKNGTSDLNELKASLRCGMGSCGGKTCTTLIERMVNTEGDPQKAMTTFTLRPLEMEVSLETFAGTRE